MLDSYTYLLRLHGPSIPNTDFSKLFESLGPPLRTLILNQADEVFCSYRNCYDNDTSIVTSQGPCTKVFEACKHLCSKWHYYRR